MSLSDSNGNGRHGDDGDFMLDVSALKIKVGKLEKEHDKHEEILMKMSDTQHLLSERTIALEIQKENDSVILQKLQKESGLQTKLLSAILLALVGAAIKIVFHV